MMSIRLCGTVLLAGMACSVTRAQDGPKAGGPVVTLRASAKLVSVDVVVVDAHGNPVHALQQGDFQVRENKAEQIITSFEEHAGGGIEQTKLLAAEPGVLSNRLEVRGEAVNVLLVDWLNTPPSAQAYLRDQLVKFLRSGQTSGTPTAIFTLGTSLRMLQDFTRDPELLKAAVRKQGVKFSPLLESDGGAPSAEVQALEDAIQAASDPVMKAMLEGLQSTTVDADALRKSQSDQVRVRKTLEALSELGRYLAGNPARKNLIWASGSFPVVIERDPQTTGDPFIGKADLRETFRRTVDLLARSKVAVYPLDPNGLQTAPSMDTSNSQTVGLSAARRMNGSNSLSPGDDKFYNDQIKAHSTMEELAEATGGTAFFQTNDLAAAVRQAENNGSNFYTLTYTPLDDTKDGVFRTIAIKVQGRGLHLSYRRGYYGHGLGDVGETGTSAVLSDAMGEFVPQSSEVLFTVQPVKVEQGTTGKIIGERAYAAAPHELYTMNVTADVSTLRFTEAQDGKVHATLEFATTIYDAKGKVVDSRSDRAVLALEPARAESIRQGGLRFHQTVELPQGGSETVRTAVYDDIAGRVGTVQMTAQQVRAAASARK